MEFVFHLDMFLFLPVVAVSVENCLNPECGARHFVFTAGWLVFSVHIKLT